MNAATPLYASQRGIDIMTQVQAMVWLIRTSAPDHATENIMRFLAENLDHEAAAAIFAGITLGLTTTPPEVL